MGGEGKAIDGKEKNDVIGGLRMCEQISWFLVGCMFNPTCTLSFGLPIGKMLHCTGTKER